MKVTGRPIVSGALGTLIEDLEIRGQVETIQTTALLRSARILKRVLGTRGDLISLNWNPSRNADVKNSPRSNNNNS